MDEKGYPKKLYLQLLPNDYHEKFEYFDSFCDEQINEDDVVYISLAEHRRLLKKAKRGAK